MNFLLVVIFLLPLLWILSSLRKLYRNYQAAHLSGLPLVISPLDPDHPIYILIKVPLRPVLERVLPASIYDTIKITIFGWEFRDKHALHDRIGPAFMLVTPGLNELWCADAAMAQSILGRRKDFVQSAIVAKVMGFLGENILTSNGESWARQRRLIAPNLNERISAVVWQETGEQANQMAEFLLSRPNGETRETISGLRAIAINVLGRVGYGQSKPFRPLELPRDPTAKISYVDAISLCVELVVFAAFVPARVLCLPVFPKSLRTLGQALRRLPTLTKDMLDQERRRAATDSDESDNVMSMLVRLSDLNKSSELGSEAAQHLRESEISGNMFVFTGAGFDTTANTLAYAVVLLSAYPEWQAWIREEIDQVLDSTKGAFVPDYATVFPKLTRCLALMFETLRLFPPIIHISRAVDTSQSLLVDGKQIYVPAPCNVYINTACLHTYPSVWGKDSLEFRPSRWLAPDSDGGASGLVTPARGTFLPWSAGPRACPGQKMSQVEFVRTIATLFRQCSVEPVVRKGENLEQAKARLSELMEDSQPRVTLQMNNPEEVHLKWIRR